MATTGDPALGPRELSYSTPTETSGIAELYTLLMRALMVSPVTTLCKPLPMSESFDRGYDSAIRSKGSAGLTIVTDYSEMSERSIDHC